MRLRFFYRRNGPSLLIADGERLNSRGLAAAKGGCRRWDGILTGAPTVPVFLLLRQVKMPKKLDLDGLARGATAGGNLGGVAIMIEYWAPFYKVAA